VTDEQLWSFLKRLVSALGALLGEQCEVVLHDLRRAPDASIVAIANGHVTGRKIGDPSTNLALPVLKNPYGEYDRWNYRTVSRNGKVLKSSSLYLKDDSGRIFAALCVNLDISPYLVVQNLLQDLTKTGETVDETFATDVNELITKILDETLGSLRKPVNQLDRDEKRRVIQSLYSKGVFNVKRSVERVAALLDVSKVTVYGYLNEIQAEEEPPRSERGR
jgi:predicted transcriptional regulator YheO